MRLLVFALVVCATQSLVQSSQDSPEILRAKEQLTRVEQLVEHGGLPRARLEEARENLAEAQDYAVLRRSLYGSVKVEDLTEVLSREMVTSASRLVDLQQKRVSRLSKLVDQGVVARNELTPLVEELENRRKSLTEAESRVRLWTILLEQARAEQVRQMEAEQQASSIAVAEADTGAGILSPTKARQLENDYERVFRRGLPISARGDTSFHRLLGFDHTGRIDVAVGPDSPEGQWLRLWLERGGVPFIAFKTAVKGQASAPHIHIGPPSSRLRTTD
ncbi:MAG: hypothetical protein HY820_43510 [Acidobacteria bacterium]|nr:hypothetical protein [Acidobacteriota bacterium]